MKAIRSNLEGRPDRPHPACRLARRHGACPSLRRSNALRCPSRKEADFWAGDPASIARWIADFDAPPPLRMSEAEEVQCAGRTAGDEGLHTVAKMQDRFVEDRP